MLEFAAFVEECIDLRFAFIILFLREKLITLLTNLLLLSKGLKLKLVASNW